MIKWINNENLAEVIIKGWPVQKTKNFKWKIKQKQTKKATHDLIMSKFKTRRADSLLTFVLAKICKFRH